MSNIIPFPKSTPKSLPKSALKSQHVNIFVDIKDYNRYPRASDHFGLLEIEAPRHYLDKGLIDVVKSVTIPIACVPIL